MRALLVEGGGVRAAFAAGVLDALLEHDEPFDLVAGTSAGALLAAAYLAGQKGRSLRVLRDPGCRAAFGRITDFLRGVIWSILNCSMKRQIAWRRWTLKP